MSGEDQIKWVALTLTHSPQQETGLEKMAQAAGLSLKCSRQKVGWRVMWYNVSPVHRL
jgi:hypothetical protein